MHHPLSEMASLADHLLKMVGALRQHGGELEIRTGTYTPATGFANGVTEDHFRELESDLEAMIKLKDEKQYTEHVDYHYLHNEVPTRTRVQFDDERMSIHTEHVQKKEVQSVVVSGILWDNEACRVSLSAEKPVVPPTSCVPMLVRMKHRRSFRDNSSGKTSWSYDLSKTWSAPTREGVEVQQHTKAPQLEFECEIADEDGDYLRRRSDEEVVASIETKLKMLLGDVLEVAHSRDASQNGQKRR